MVNRKNALSLILTIVVILLSRQAQAEPSLAGLGDRIGFEFWLFFILPIMIIDLFMSFFSFGMTTYPGYPEKTYPRVEVIVMSICFAVSTLGTVLVIGLSEREGFFICCSTALSAVWSYSLLRHAIRALRS